MAANPIQGKLAILDSSMIDRLPAYSQTLFAAKTQLGITFDQLAKELGRTEVAVAGIFYGQVMASHEDVKKLSEILKLPPDSLQALAVSYPDRGRAGPMPPTDPLIYRLYEIVMNYGYAYKATLTEKLGDGIVSAIAFKTWTTIEEDENGASWVTISLKGKWLPFTRF